MSAFKNLADALKKKKAVSEDAAAPKKKTSVEQWLRGKRGQ
jgi:hypothetical protein